MDLFIPDIGTKLKLTESWIFQLFEESRNHEMLKVVGRENLKKTIVSGSEYFWRKHECYEMFLPKDSILTVRRIYVRNGKSDFSSVTFYLNDTTHPLLLYVKKNRKTCGSFWAKLTDVNKIKCDIIKNTVQSFDFESDNKNDSENKSL